MVGEPGRIQAAICNRYSGYILGRSVIPVHSCSLYVCTPIEEIKFGDWSGQLTRHVNSTEQGHGL